MRLKDVVKKMCERKSEYCDKLGGTIKSVWEKKKWAQKRSEKRDKDTEEDAECDHNK